VASTPTETQTVRAQAKWVRMSARKGRIVAEHIRGRSVPEARAVLAFTQRAAAREIEKVLASAVANAEANHGLVGDELVVHTAVVDEGPTLKRWRARARGRVARIKKHTCHITVLLAPMAEAPAVAEPPKRSEPAPVEAPEAPETEATSEPKPKPAARSRAKAAEKTEEETAESKPKKPRTPRRKKTED
jgi:large subunit ribosomal protein L22